MFFFIRSAFWLTIVFSTMSWTTGAVPARPHALRDVIAETGASVVGAARQAALAKLPESANLAAQPRIRDLIENAAFSYVSSSSPTAEAPGEARAWCVKTAAQCSSDAARLTALVVANQSDDVGDDRIAPQNITAASTPRHHDRAGPLPHQR